MSSVIFHLYEGNIYIITFHWQGRAQLHCNYIPHENIPELQLSSSQGIDNHNKGLVWPGY